MARARRLEIIIAGDASGATRALGQTRAQVATTGGSFAKFGKVAAVGAVAAGVAAAAIGKALYDIGSQFDDAYDKIRTGTGATGENLEQLKDSFRNVAREIPASFEDVSTAIADLNTRLDLTGRPLEDLSGQFLNLSRITETDVSSNIQTMTRVFGDWGVEADAMPGALDKIFRASQSSGIGLDQLSQTVVQFGAPMRNLGFTMDESLALFAKWEQEGVNVSTAMGGMRIAVGKFARDGMSPMEGFNDVLAQAEAGTFSITDAMEVFGARAGADMFAAITEGRFDIEDMMSAISDGSDTINQAAEDTEDFSEKFQRLKNRAFLALEPVAMRVFDGMGDAMDSLGPKVEQLVRWFQDELVPVVERNWPKIQETIETVMTAVGDVIDSVVELVSALWEQFGDDIMGHIQRVWPAVQQIIEGVMGVIKGVIQTVTAIISGDWGKVWEGLKTTFGGVWKVMVGTVRVALSAIRTAIGAAWQLVRNITEGAWGGIRRFLGNVWDGIRNGVRGLRDAIGSIWSGLKSIIAAPVNWIIRNVVDPFLGFIRTVAGFVGMSGSIPGPFGGVSGGGSDQGGGSGGRRGRGSGDGPGLSVSRSAPQSVIDEALNGTGDGHGLAGAVASGVAMSLPGGLGAMFAGGPTVNPLTGSVAGFADKITQAIGGMRGLLGMTGGPPPFKGVMGGLLTAPINHVIGMFRDVKDKYAAPVLSGGIGWEKMWQAVQAIFPDAALHSALRPGAITATGNASYHGMGRAIDISPRMDIFDWIVANYAKQSKEIIFSPAGGRQIHNGSPHVYSEPTRGDHWDHIHWAMAKGTPGWVKVKQPTAFVAGEAGTEYMSVSRRPPGGGLSYSPVVNVTINGNPDRTTIAEVEKAVSRGVNTPALDRKIKRLAGVR